MKLKKIISLCKSNKHISLYTDGSRDSQWLSDGIGAYLLDDYIELDTSKLCFLYDIDDKAQDKISMYDLPLPAGINFEDNILEESEVEELGLSINYNGGTLLPLMTEEGILYIQQKYLTPLTDNSQDTWSFFLRHDNHDKPLIIVKIGLFIAAVISTYKMPELFIDKLETLYKQTELSILIEKKRNEQSEINDKETSSE